jgi:hypothetical protein
MRRTSKKKPKAAGVLRREPAIPAFEDAQTDAGRLNTNQDYEVKMLP